MKPKTLPGPQHATRPEISPAILLSALAAGLVGLALYRRSLPVPLVKLAWELAAPLLLGAGGFLSAWLAARARARGPLQRQRFVRRGGRPLPKPLELARAYLDKSRERLANTDWAGNWLPWTVMVVASLGTFYLGYRGWTLVARDPGAMLDQWLFGSLIAICFPLLVLERRFAAMPERRVAEAGVLTMLLRLLIVVLLLIAISYLLRWLALPYVLLLERSALLLTILVTAEILLRNATYLFVPFPPLMTRPARAESLLASLLKLQKPSLGAMSASVSRQFGIDLSRSWALGFLHRAAFPALMGLVIAGWLMTGVTALDLNQRAVYEAFGSPQAVFHSGLHVHLPWPFGRLKPVEFGAVREIPIVFPGEEVARSASTTELSDDEDEEERPISASVKPTPPTIEGPPPDGADRLWDASHPSEASYLVASNRNGQELFEVVNIDIQILYRVGLSDQAAMNAVYSVDVPEDLIRAAAGRMLARYFARYTIPDVLGQNREKFIRGFQGELQERLNELNSGVDILAVVIEAIHPPADAAAAYQDVQAAGIRSEIAVATARGEASSSVIHANANATRMRANATAGGTELIDQAKVDTALFAGDVTAYQRDGAAFLFERRLADVAKAIQPLAPITILDAHITANQMPTLDLRPAGSPNTPAAAAAGQDEER